MKRQSILLEAIPLEGGEWTQIGHPNTPVDIFGSITATRDGQTVIVVFGWDDDEVPRMWLNDRPTAVIRETPKRAHIGDGNLAPLADLRDGPIEMDGPHCRWRWRLIDWYRKDHEAI